MKRLISSVQSKSDLDSKQSRIDELQKKIRKLELVTHRPGAKMGNADRLSRVYACLATCVPTLGLKQEGGGM